MIEGKGHGPSSTHTGKPGLHSTTFKTTYLISKWKTTKAKANKNGREEKSEEDCLMEI